MSFGDAERVWPQNSGLRGHETAAKDLFRSGLRCAMKD
jgi:hypothetical protein